MTQSYPELYTKVNIALTEERMSVQKLIITISFFISKCQGCRVWIPDLEEVWKFAIVKSTFDVSSATLELQDADGNVKIRTRKQNPFFWFINH